MHLLRAWFLLGLLAAWVNAAEEKPFMSFYHPPASPLDLEEHHSYESAALRTRVGYNIYLPPNYNEPGNTSRYPVIYWLHGRGCCESNDQFPAATIDVAIRAKKIPPLVFVYASGGGMSFYSDSFDGRWPAETTIIKELIPQADREQKRKAGESGCRSCRDKIYGKRSSERPTRARGGNGSRRILARWKDSGPRRIERGQSEERSSGCRRGNGETELGRKG
jgi:hypothetical protein